MAKTLLTRISKLEQYNVANKTVLWKDPAETVRIERRWANVYGQLQINDNAIFIAVDKLLIGTVSQVNNRQSILCSNILEVNCSNDQFLQLNEIYPELISRVKANFQPFIHPRELNLTQLIKDVKNGNFISFYILSNIAKYNELSDTFKVNDRIIVIDSNNQFENVKLLTNNGLVDFSRALDVPHISVEGLTLEEMLEKNKSINRKSVKSNNLIRIQNIKEAITGGGVYKFNTFFAYYDSLFNKTVYGAGGGLDSSEESKLSATRNIEPLNQILFGPPGTGKTYSTINKAIAIVNPEFNLTQPRDKIKKEFERLMEDGQIVFTTFHQSMSYEDFIEGIKPETNEVEGAITYGVIDGIFKLLCQEASSGKQSNFEVAYNSLLKEINDNNDEILELKTPTGKPYWVQINSKNNLTLKTGKGKKPQGTLVKEAVEKETNGIKQFGGWEGYVSGLINHLKTKHNLVVGNKETKLYVLIIDEINRGNVSQIFGELITLIEEDKRLGKEEALKAILPYSKVKFGVPPNLYIIGTMNTADRSVEALDAALRRRFCFEEIPPNPELIATAGKLKAKNGILDSIDLPHLLITINKRIEKLLDKDHQIGHSYFMDVTSLEELQRAFQNKIIPLLQEYFFGDYGKIGLVLGEGFFESTEKQNNNQFASFNGYDASDFAEKPIYRIKKITELKPEDFNNAIKALLGNKE